MQLATWQMVHLPSCQLHISVNRTAQIFLELHFCVELHTKKKPCQMIVKPVKRPSVQCRHLQNAKAPRPLSRRRWNFARIFSGSWDKTSRKQNFEFRTLRRVGPLRAKPERARWPTLTGVLLSFILNYKNTRISFWSSWYTQCQFDATTCIKLGA